MAANPVIIQCPANTWVKVIDGVSSGVVHLKEGVAESFLQTYRVAGQAAPIDNSDAVPIFTTENFALISNDAPIDVYIKAIGKAGSVRVDT